MAKTVTIEILPSQFRQFCRESKVTLTSEELPGVKLLFKFPKLDEDDIDEIEKGKSYIEDLLDDLETLDDDPDDEDEEESEEEEDE